MIQPCLLELIKLISEIIIAITSIIIAVVAVIGLTQWRRELKGKAKLEISNNLISLAYQFRDEIFRARNVFVFPNEWTDRKKTDSETIEQTESLNEHYARINRLRKPQDTIAKLYEYGWKGQPFTDVQLSEVIKPIDKKFLELFTAVDFFYSRQSERKRQLMDFGEDDWLKNDLDIIKYHQNDEFSKSVDSTINEFSQNIKNIFK